MSRIAFGKTCPRCKSKSVQRLKRKDWMRWLPASKHYRCSTCRSRFILLGDWFAWLTRNGAQRQ